MSESIFKMKMTMEHVPPIPQLYDFLTWFTLVGNHSMFHGADHIDESRKTKSSLVSFRETFSIKSWVYDCSVSFIQLLHINNDILTTIIDFLAISSTSNVSMIHLYDACVPFIDHFERCPVRATARIASNRESCRYIDSAIFRSIDNKSD